MLNQILQFIGNDLKDDYRKVSLINGYSYGEVRLYKIGKLAILNIYSARKNSTITSWETLAKVPAEYFPTETVSNNAYYIPSDGAYHSCEIRVLTTGEVGVTGARAVPSYGINGTIFYKTK